MVHSSSTVQPRSFRLFLELAVLLGFDNWTAKILHAYLQAAELSAVRYILVNLLHNLS